jgi:hypothetical protein
MGWLDGLRDDVPAHVLKIADDVWSQRDLFLRWPKQSLCFWPGCVRVPYHNYNAEQRGRLQAARIQIDGRSNGPAIMAFLLAGGERPARSIRRKQWSVHHIYDGQFPFPGRTRSVRAVTDDQLFTHSAGLVAIHPLADALADEIAYFAWLLRREAYDRFQFDPDGVFGSSLSD